jgi:hypothetical protein
MPGHAMKHKPLVEIKRVHGEPGILMDEAAQLLHNSGDCGRLCSTAIVGD